jgi:hypothetical protein
MKLNIRRSVEQDVEVDIQFPHYWLYDSCFDSGQRYQVFTKVIEERTSKVNFVFIKLTFKGWVSVEVDLCRRKPLYALRASDLGISTDSSDYLPLTEEAWNEAYRAAMRYVQAIGTGDIDAAAAALRFGGAR